MFGAAARHRCLVRATVLLVCGFGFLAVDAAPASAHGLVGTQPSNYETRVLSVTPSIPGLEVEVRDLGSRIEVRNETAHTVTVLGYSGEPYLRVGPNGVEENQRSPSVFLNRTTTIVANPPPSYRATATPQWTRISGGNVALWHDHRVHWMGAGLPPAVAQAPGDVHLISTWLITLQYQGHPVLVRGDLRWIPGPSAFPRLGVALLVAVLVTGLGLTALWGDVVALALAALAAAVTVLVVGEWRATSAGPWIALLSNIYSLLGIFIAVIAAGAMFRARRAPHDATAIVLVAAVVLTFGSGLADITYLSHSQLPTTLHHPLARTLVAVVLGGSIGVLVTAARTLRRPVLMAPAAPPGPAAADPATA